MWSGRKTLASIDQALHEVRRQVQELDTQIQRASTQLLQLRQEQGGKYKTLATVRLGELTSGDVIDGLDAADRRVGELLVAREGELKALQGRIEQSQRDQRNLEAEREAQMNRVGEAVEALDQAEATTQKRLQQDPAYRDQLARTRLADVTAGEAEAKTQQAESDRIDKGKPYESDPLFTYLWKREYGTSGYSANPLTRFFDKGVANLCNYHDARPNYSMLLEIPLRLREHAGRVRANADKEFEALKTLDEAAANADGIPALRHAVEQAEERMDEIDNRIHKGEKRFRQFMQDRASYAVGEDKYFRRCIDILLVEFQRDSIVSLRRQAEGTQTPEDDLIVQELVDFEYQEDQLEEALTHHKQLQERHLTHLQELEGVRREFKRHRYDDVHSTFSNGELVSTILYQFLRGIANSDDLWRTIRRHQRTRRVKSNPGFGSGGFGRGAGDVWRMPSPRGGGSWSGGRGGGGFRTGGGF